MIEFFRDVLNGPLYIITTILAIIFIMAIIGFLMERKKLEKEQKEKIAVISTPDVATVAPVDVQEQPIVNTTVQEQQPEVGITLEIEIPTQNVSEPTEVVNEENNSSDQIFITPAADVSNSNQETEEDVYPKVKTPVIIFEDPDQKEE